MALDNNMFDNGELDLNHVQEVVTGISAKDNATPVTESTDRFGQVRDALPDLLKKIGWYSVGVWTSNPLLTKPNEYVYLNNQRFAPKDLPYQVDSATNPNPQDLVDSGVLNDISKYLDASDALELFDQSYSSIGSMISNATVGQRCSTGKTVWKRVSATNNNEYDFDVVGVLWGDDFITDGTQDDVDIQRAILYAEEKGVSLWTGSLSLSANKPIKIIKDKFRWYSNNTKISKGAGFSPDADGYRSIIKCLASDRPVEVSISVVVRGLEIDGFDKSVSGFIGTGVVRGAQISELTIDNCDDAIHLGPCWSMGVNYCNINNCGEAGITLGGSKYGMYAGANVANNITLLGNITRGCERSGIYVANGSNHTIIGNTSEQNNINLELRVTNGCTVQGNYFEAQTGPYNVQIGRTQSQTQAITSDLTFFGNYIYVENGQPQVWLFGCVGGNFFGNPEVFKDGIKGDVYSTASGSVCTGNSFRNATLSSSIPRTINNCAYYVDGPALPVEVFEFSDSHDSTKPTKEVGKTSAQGGVLKVIHTGGVMSKVTVMGQSKDISTVSFIDEVYYISFGSVAATTKLERNGPSARTYSLSGSTNLAVTLAAAGNWSIQVFGETFR